MNPSYLQVLLEQGVEVLPYLIIFGVGAGLAWQLRGRNRTAAFLAIGGFALMALGSVVGWFASAWLARQGLVEPSSFQIHSVSLYAWLSSIRAGVVLGAWILLITALRRALLGPDPHP